MTNRTILLVADDDAFSRMLSERCENFGLEVQHAQSLVSASIVAAQRVPDIVCVDLQLPTGNGLEFCESLAANPTTEHVPVIVLTEQGSPRTRRTGKQRQAYFVKKNGDSWSTLEPLIRQLTAEAHTGNEPPQLSDGDRQRRDDSYSTSPKTLMVGMTSAANGNRVVVADDDAGILSMLSQRLSTLGCSVFGADNALDAINLIGRIVPDLVCLDVGMPDGNGLSVCEMMASSEQLRRIPVIILTGRSDDSTIRRCHDMLVYYVQKSADTWQRVEPLVRELLHLQEPPSTANPVQQESCSADAAIPLIAAKDDGNALLDAVFAMLGVDSEERRAISDRQTATSGTSDSADIPWVLCIDDDANFSDALRIRLEQHGVAVLRAFNGMEGFRMAFMSPAGAILLDYNMPNGQGDYILGRLKDNPITASIPVIVITGMRDKMLERRMLAMGAAAYLVKPIGFELLKEELAKHIDILDRPGQSPAEDAQQKPTRLQLDLIST